MRKPSGQVVEITNRRTVVGRPLAIDNDLANQILDAIAEGATLRQIADVPGMPSRRTIAREVVRNEGFCLAYTRARMMQLATWGEEILEIADRDLPCEPEQAMIELAHRKVKIDARKFVAARLAAFAMAGAGDGSEGRGSDRPDTAEWARQHLQDARDADENRARVSELLERLGWTPPEPAPTEFPILNLPGLNASDEVPDKHPG